MDYIQYLELVNATVRKNLKPGASSITAAALGALLRQSAPDVNFKIFGKRSLLEVLRDLEAKGQVCLADTEKGALAVTPCSQPERRPIEPVAKFNPVKKPVWEAFVLAVPAGRRFMQRRTGLIRAGLDVPPSPADEWVEIKPVSLSVQKAWAEQFLETLPADPYRQARESLSGQSWHVQGFAKALREADEEVARNWNRFRSGKVSSLIKDWLVENNLPIELGFQTETSAVYTEHGALDGVGLLGLSPEEMRRVILAALATLPLDRLLDIPVPAGSLLAAIPKAKAR